MTLRAGTVSRIARFGPACTLIALSATFGQQPPAAAQPQFEVASIRPSVGYEGRTLVQVLPGGGLRTSGATLKGLISLAFDVPSFLISGGPAWIDADHFDIVAKSDQSVSPEDVPSDPRQITESQYRTARQLMRPRLQTLLADRFQLRLLRETREEPVYALIAAKSGPRLRPSNEFRGLRVGRGQLTGNGATMEMLTTALAGQLGRPVLDRTGLKGAFGFELEWGPFPAQAVAPPAPDSDGPSIFTAVQEQLGLKLESVRAPVAVLVIDRVAKPSGN